MKPVIRQNFIYLDIFQEEGGGLPNSKVFEELFCLILDIYQEGGGGYLIPKMSYSTTKYRQRTLIGDEVNDFSREMPMFSIDSGLLFGVFKVFDSSLLGR